MTGTMKETKFQYQCKTFPYKKYPFGYKYLCKNEEKITHSGSFTDLTAKETAVEKETRLDIKNGKYYPAIPKRKYTYPYFRSCGDYYRRSERPVFTSFWCKKFLNEWEREKENLICIYPPSKDSYEILCDIPICEPNPPVYTRKRKTFNPLHCVFCDRSLYYGGAILDLHETVPAIIRQSDERDDDIAYRIGVRTRITLHKSCYDSYIKKPVTYLLDYDPDKCDTETEVMPENR